MLKNPELSIVILNYNTKELLGDCLDSIKKYESEVSLEVVVSDNASSDGSADFVKDHYPWVKLVQGENTGFSKGNNRARSFVHGQMVLFLNPDTVLNKWVLAKTVEYLKNHKEVGVVTCKLVLPSGKLDRDARRSFPTPWVGFTHLVLRIDRLFPKSKLFSRYWYGYIPENVTHEVDSVEGSFLLTRKNILDDVGWFDEDYLFNAEDIDLCWKIKEKGWKLIYYPEVSIVHIKGAAKGKSKVWRHKVTFSQRLKMRLTEIDSMEIFYRKHYWEKYPLPLDYLIIVGIRLFKFIRFVEVVAQSI